MLPDVADTNSTHHFADQPSPKARVLVVEPDSGFRMRLVELINVEPDFTCSGEAGDIASIPSLIAEQKPDLVLLGGPLNHWKKFELMAALRARFPQVAVLVLSDDDRAECARRALQAGAKGYLLKQEAPATLLAAVLTILHGEVYVSPSMTPRLVYSLIKDPVSRRCDHSAQSS